MLKNPSVNAEDTRDMGWIPGLGRSPGRGNGNPLQYSCLGNPMDRGAWWATVHKVAKSQRGLSDSPSPPSTNTHMKSYMQIYTEICFSGRGPWWAWCASETGKVV